MRINFLNPFGTDAFDELIRDVLGTSARPDVHLDVTHLDVSPQLIDYYAQKSIVEVEVLRAAVRAQEDGYDALVIGCCYDPALIQARELLDIPVVGPLEASVSNAHAFGHRYAVVTDMHKAVPEIEDRIRAYGQEANCRGVANIGWFATEMLTDPKAVAEDAYLKCLEVLDSTGAETVIIGCTLVSGYYEQAARSDERLRALSVINPNVMALKQAEMLADMNASGQYRISRKAFYQRVDSYSAAMATELREVMFPTG